MEPTNKSNNSCISQQRSLIIVCYILILLIGITFINQESIFDKLPVDIIKKTVENRKNIAILVIVDSPGAESLYKTARDSLICYAKMQNYSLEVIYTSNNVEFSKTCPHNDLMLKRHCVAANFIIPKYDWTLFLDADIGVINPNRRIEEYIDDSVNILFDDRFFDWEVATGSYLAKNSVVERNFCERLLNRSGDTGGVFAYEACARMVLGANRYWAGKLKIITKGIGWVRDGWLTGTKYCSRDFMFHGWKSSKLGGEWVMPFEKPDELAKCAAGLATFNTKAGFNISIQEIDVMLKKKYVEVEKQFLAQVGTIANSLS